MSVLEQVKIFIDRLSEADRNQVLLHILRLKYASIWAEIHGTIHQPAETHDLLAIAPLTYEELLERLHLLEGIREGLRDVAEGHTISQEEISRRFDQWRA
ncbi:MAG: hypothetical protein SFV52_14935 [Saprospiraceae bacterium]|nr:hypothetical protein [Saprospiraceae bacterium]